MARKSVIRFKFKGQKAEVFQRLHTTWIRWDGVERRISQCEPELQWVAMHKLNRRTLNQ